MSSPSPAPSANQAIRESIMRELADYCEYYNVPLQHVVETMHALKVVPMIRGISFEYFAYDKLKEILSESVWKVEKPAINAQAEIKDIDVLITHLSSGKRISVECKLAGKNSFRAPRLGQGTVRIKCMRSRAVGRRTAARTLARRYNVTVDDVLRHPDNYRDVDFDFVVTSIGNAFWRTMQDGTYTFRPKPAEIDFLRRLFGDQTLEIDQLKEKTFNYLLIAKSSDLTVSPQNRIHCVRRKCVEVGTYTSCGFIPNFPIVNLTNTRTWRPIEMCEEMFEDFVNEQ